MQLVVHRPRPELTIDGDVSTKFENRYNDIGQGDIETLPVTIDWDLGKTCYSPA